MYIYFAKRSDVRAVALVETTGVVLGSRLEALRPRGFTALGADESVCFSLVLEGVSCCRGGVYRVC